MPFDSLALTAIKNELTNKLIGARVEKIFMPMPNIILIAFHSTSGNQKLLISLGAHPRVHLTTQVFENPAVAPSFCMHLRKYLGGGKLIAISQPPFERILELEFSVFNEFRDNVTYKLVLELMGKYSNAICVDPDGKITDCVKHIQPDSNSPRAVLPNFVYEYPQDDKISPSDRKAVISKLMEFDGGSLDNYIIGFIRGFAPSSVSEILYKIKYNNEDNNYIDETLANKISSELLALSNKIENNDITPCVSEMDGEPQDYYLYPFESVKSDWKYYNTISQAIDYCMSLKQNISAFRSTQNSLTQAIKSAIAKTEKKRLGLEQKLRECADMDKYKLYGELLLSYLYAIKSGQSSVELLNYYTGENIIIPLDKKLSPNHNAQLYFKKYAKLKKGLTYLHEQLESVNEQINYLQSIQQFLSRCETLEELKEISIEMEDNGIIKRQTQKPKKNAAPKYKTTTIDGFTVRIGSNNMQNDSLVRDSASNDVWLHAKDAHGSHVVIETQGKQVSDEILVKAAQIAAYFSKAGSADKVAVDYTLIRHVKKPPSAPLGRVIYTNQKTLFITPQKPEL